MISHDLGLIIISATVTFTIRTQPHANPWIHPDTGEPIAGGSGMRQHVRTAPAGSSDDDVDNDDDDNQSQGMHDIPKKLSTYCNSSL